jgi:hypothetical protein
MYSYLSIIKIILVITLLSGCVSRSHSDHYFNSYVERYYAIVVDIEPLEFESEAGTSAAMGAIIGASGYHGGDMHTKIQSAIFHAFFYGLFTRISEGSNEGYRYELNDLNGEEFSIISQTSGIVNGDCVEILEGDAISIAKTADVHCFKEELKN